ncbi:MAG: ribonuclease / adenosylcobalamin/alpha-ribazole phosphatase [Actinomycetota bacterium]|nr:ribonuclease / adenosylcobalamin/alpha-ribazole phosphatase [Actinomycetota bacterium]
MTARFAVEADGGSRGNPGPAAYGAVVFADGVPVRELAAAIGTATNNVAEYRSVVAALEWIAAHVADSDALVEVRMDSRLVVEQMSGRWRIKHPDMKSLAARVRSAYRPELVTFHWVPRSANQAADALVNEVLDAGPTTVIDRAP